MVARSAAEVAHNAAPQNKSDFTVEIGTLVPHTQHCRRVADSYRHVFPHFRQPSLDRVVLCTPRRNSTSRVTATVSQQQDQAQQIHSATWFSFARMRDILCGSDERTNILWATRWGREQWAQTGMRDYCTGGITPRELQSDTRLGTCIPSSSKSSWQLLRNIQRASCNCMFPSDYTPSLGQSRRTTGTKTSTGTTERCAHFVPRDTNDRWSFRESLAPWRFAAASSPGARGVTSITSRSNWQAAIVTPPSSICVDSRR